MRLEENRMASGKTTNYGLNQWVKSDRVQMAEFNADNARIDAALGEMVKILYGTYTGTGNYGSASPTTLDFADTLGRAPRFLLIMSPSGGSQMLLLKGMTGQYTKYDDMSRSYCNITWTETGISWYNAYGAGTQLNGSNVAYYYIAIA